MKIVHAFCFTLVVAGSLAAQSKPADTAWPTYGGDPGGQRYTSAAQINRSNLQGLRVAWTFRTGEDNGETGGPVPWRATWGAFEATPILFKGSLYLSSPFDAVYALNPATGAKRWSFEPQLDWSRSVGVFTSRGVASWSETSAAAKGTACRDRIFIGTLDARLIALDADSGRPCPGFGNAGTVDLTVGVDYVAHSYWVTSPPTVVGDVLVVGSAILDNQQVDVELGVVRGFDARTGKLLWTWDPLPSARTQKLRTGAGNTWSIIAADLQRGLVYLPTSSPSPDTYGGLRPGDNRDADSIVCLDARTGKKVWSFQLVHHDLWDYDLAAEPCCLISTARRPPLPLPPRWGRCSHSTGSQASPSTGLPSGPFPKAMFPAKSARPPSPFLTSRRSTRSPWTPTGSSASTPRTMPNAGN